MAAIHFWLGDVRCMIDAIRTDSLPVHRILDMGCGTGLVLKPIGRTLDVDVVGAEHSTTPGYFRARADHQRGCMLRSASARGCRVLHEVVPSFGSPAT